MICGVLMTSPLTVTRVCSSAANASGSGGAARLARSAPSAPAPQPSASRRQPGRRHAQPAPAAAAVAVSASAGGSSRTSVAAAMPHSAAVHSTISSIARPAWFMRWLAVGPSGAVSTSARCRRRARCRGRARGGRRAAAVGCTQPTDHHALAIHHPRREVDIRHVRVLGQPTRDLHRIFDARGMRQVVAAGPDHLADDLDAQRRGLRTRGRRRRLGRHDRRDHQQVAHAARRRHGQPGPEPADALGAQLVQPALGAQVPEARPECREHLPNVGVRRHAKRHAERHAWG